MGARLAGLFGAERRDFLIVFAIWLPLAAAGILVDTFAVAGHFPFVDAKEGEVSDDSIYILLLYASIDFFALVVPLVYAVLRWRERGDAPGERGDSPVQRRSHRWFPGLWTAYAATIGALAIVFPGVTGLLQIWGSIGAKPAQVVKVTGEQWDWKFEYPKYELTVKDELVLPANERTRFEVSSKDVIHSFWVPAFRIKWDAIPGETRQVAFTPTTVASTEEHPELRVQCAELCGVGHQDMQATIKVVSPAEFEAWAKETKMKKAHLKEVGETEKSQQMSTEKGA